MGLHVGGEGGGVGAGEGWEAVGRLEGVDRCAEFCRDVGSK